MKTVIGQLFDIQYGEKEYHNKEWLDGNEGKTVLISSKGEDNGVYGFFAIEAKYNAPFISVPSTGTVGQAFVQEKDCSVDDNCLVLIPKEKLSKEALYEVAYQIRINSWKYKYGRQITPLRLSKQIINLTSLKKDWNAYEKSITPESLSKRQNIKPKLIKQIKLKDLFFVKKGQGSYLEKLDIGNTPVVSTKTGDNGVCGFFDIAPLFKKYCITIGRIECNPRVQLLDFSTVPDDMFVLIPKKTVTPEFIFYVASVIKLDGWKFNYSRKVTKERLDEIILNMPIQKDGFDLKYIVQVAASSYGYNFIGRN